MESWAAAPTSRGVAFAFLALARSSARYRTPPERIPDRNEARSPARDRSSPGNADESRSVLALEMARWAPFRDANPRDSVGVSQDEVGAPVVPLRLRGLHRLLPEE